MVPRLTGCCGQGGREEEDLAVQNRSQSSTRPRSTGRTDDGAWQSDGARRRDAHVALAAPTDDPDDAARRAVLLLRSRQ